MNGLVVGIDLGTTFSAVAYVAEDGRPHVVANSEGKPLTPSVVLIEDDQIVVGELAANQMIVKEERVARCIKRCMWDDSYRFCGLTPIEISAEILKKLKRDTEAALATTVGCAVITCPAYFAANEVENTRRAGRLAGFEVQEIVREPTAAAVYYGVEHLSEGERVLVYDLGGGTFDTTILQLRNGTFCPVATLGDRQLGGHDWTIDLVNHVAREVTLATGTDPLDEPIVHQMLYERCETAKRDLAKLDRVVVCCPVGGRLHEVSIDIHTFNALTESRIRRTIDSCRDVLNKAKPPLRWSDVDKILPVGGSTRLRRVAEALQEVSGKQPVQIGEVDTAVALGAAILAKGMVRPHRGMTTVGGGGFAGMVPVRFERSCPRNLGTRIIVWDGNQGRIENSTIIPYHTPVPAEQTRGDYATSMTNQPHFDVPIVEFDGIGEDVILGTYRFCCRPGTPTRSPIAVTFRYDRDAAVEVRAKDLSSGEELRGEKVSYVEPDQGQLRRKPRDIVFALDVSGSMDGEKLVRAKEALRATASALLEGGQGVRVALVTFATTAARCCDLTGELEPLAAAVGRMNAVGSTRMDSGIACAAEMLCPNAGERACEIALVTDGMPDSKDLAIEAAEEARRAGIRISAVGIGSGSVDEQFLRQIASGVLMIDSADQLSAALPALLTESGKAPGTSITWGGTE